MSWNCQLAPLNYMKTEYGSVVLAAAEPVISIVVMKCNSRSLHSWIVFCAGAINLVQVRLRRWGASGQGDVPVREKLSRRCCQVRWWGETCLAASLGSHASKLHCSHCSQTHTLTLTQTHSPSSIHLSWCIVCAPIWAHCAFNSNNRSQQHDTLLWCNDERKHCVCVF